MNNCYCKRVTCRACNECLTESQSSTNKQIVVPVEPLDMFDLYKAEGLIPEDMTLKEFMNRPVDTALSVLELSEEF